MSHLQVQLQNLKSRIGVKPEVEENGRLLHLHKEIGGFNEWIVLTYNLQVLREVINENIKLRKEIFDLMGNLVRLVLIRCNVLKPEQCMTFPESSGDSKNGTWWAWLFAMLSPKLIQWPGPSLPSFPNIPGAPSFPIVPGAPSFPNPPQVPGFPGGASSGANQAAFLAWMGPMMANLQQQGICPPGGFAQLLATLTQAGGGSSGTGFPNPDQPGSFPFACTYPPFNFNKAA
ncbi:uncharacterized protein LOC116215950 [Punica granatum]|uniref:Uncharacterized protein n=2 Tax=Punica granatum TaxID=22663 RepID=A0A218XID3_PUNGR|nr:uncharacterized protein LOC116215950 [Punica granatum]OWM84102.1 hypothetical protein CDL15_Pgr009349 [Punica granatum]PKI51002.1 hypothetical protein CRG98_028599 [Punica granatum]